MAHKCETRPDSYHLFGLFYLKYMKFTKERLEEIAKSRVLNGKVLCKCSHEDGLTKGNLYDVVGIWGAYIDIRPDDYGSISGWDYRYFVKWIK